MIREKLEEDARATSMHDSTPSSRFWSRQKGWTETETVGLKMIELMTGTNNETKKTM
jgi:hypothetical protein